MVPVDFTPNLRRHVNVATLDAEGDTLAEVLSSVFRQAPELKGYLLDDQGTLRRHVNVFIGTASILDRDGLSDPVAPGSRVFIAQALSGG